MKIKPIIPSVYNQNYNSVKNDLNKILESNLVNAIHFDDIEDLKIFRDLIEKYNVIADVHILSISPMEELKKIIDINLKSNLRVSVHIESDIDLSEFISLAKKNNMDTGLAIKLRTPIKSILQKYMFFDYFHLICTDEENDINIFQEIVFKKIYYLNKKLNNKKPITLDCGIKEKNVIPSIKNGTSNLVIGSAIFKSENPLSTIIRFNKIIDDYI